MQHTFNKIDSPVERVGRRIFCCPGTTARAPEFTKINNIYLKHVRKIK